MAKKLRVLNTFKKDYTIPSGSFSSLGQFRNILVKEVDIFPANGEMAKIWAQKLFIEQLSEYLTTNRLQSSWKKLIQSHAPLHEYSPRCPSMQELEGLIPVHSRKYWFIHAPQDLKLEEVVIE